ncbi:GntR family transcriptional regulator [Amycolatopsis pithecellobii]|nr:FCD domain-containing protein [Amycolatopsis pithecellobii]
METDAGRKSSSRVSEVYEQIRSDILATRLAPGEKLKIQPLCERFEVSLSVVREALTRLTEQRLVRSVPQVGFTVRPLDRSGLLDLTNVRVHLETLALRWAIQRGDLEWETALVAALYRLGKTPQNTPGAKDELSEAWSIAHAEFHTALAAGCGSPLLMELRSGPYDAAEVYRRWAGPAEREPRDVHSEHTAIADAAIARDDELAATLLERHIRRTTEILMTSHLMRADETTKPR